jgi:hypothetical protein
VPAKIALHDTAEVLPPATAIAVGELMSSMLVCAFTGLVVSAQGKQQDYRDRHTEQPQ